jgi:hypothetical protein
MPSRRQPQSEAARATEKVYRARVTRLGGRVDPISQSIKMIGEITGDTPDLLAGMSGRHHDAAVRRAAEDRS